MIRRHTLQSKVWITGIAAAAIVAGVAVTPAHSHDSSPVYSGPPAGPSNAGEMSIFALNDMKKTHVLSYDTPRDLRICNDTGRASTSAVDPLPPSESPLDWPPSLRRPVRAPYTLQVQHSGATDDVRPGACDSFRARHVLISSASPLTPDSTLHVRVKAQQAPPPNSAGFSG